ncbi:MAG: cytochrome c oxidase subunit 3 [Chloroflexota bacterium]
MSTVIAEQEHEHDVHAHDDHSHEPPYEVQVRSNRLGLWIFCFSEVFLFLALLVARFYLLPGERPDLSQAVGLAATSVLLVSSFYMNRAEVAVSKGDHKRFLNSLMTTAVLGTLFFISVVFMEWNIFGLDVEIFGIELFGHVGLADGAVAAVFFAMTGMHALHVLSGIILILIVWNNGRKGLYTPERHWAVEACAIYWHYVDLVWVFFYPALYLIGTPA